MQLSLLTIVEIRLLGAIVHSAARFPVNSCTYALNTAYRAELAQRGIDSNHDKVIFNWVNAISKRCAKVKLEEGHVNFWNELKHVCKTQDIEISDPVSEADGEGAFAREPDHPENQPQRPTANKRRVSFDEARYEETQLSEHSEYLEEQTSDGKAFHGRPPTPGRPYYSQRARSADADEKDWLASKVAKHAPPPSLPPSEPGKPVPSIQTESALSEEERDAQLLDILDAFLGMSELRMARRCIRMLHDAYLVQSRRREADDAKALALDGRTLLRQALDNWIGVIQTRVKQRQQEEEWERMERKAVLSRDIMLIQKGYEHWYASHLAVKAKTMRASKLLLAMRYFRRWRNITVENNSKARQMPLRKFLEKWRDRTARRQLVYEQATAHYEECLQKRLYKEWFWRLCSRKAEDLHQERSARYTLQQWSEHSRRLQDMDLEAQTVKAHRPLRSAMKILRTRLQERQQAETTAQAHYEQRAGLNCLQTMLVKAKLGPLEKTMSLRVTLTLQRKAFSVWHLHLSRTRHAAQVDRKRVLQDAWTKWSDALRVRALAQRIDERLLAETLYKWVLQERLSLLRRTTDARLARHALLLLHSAVGDYRFSLEDRAAIFAENQRRRRLASSMVHLNVAHRHHEDAERKAVEFVNSRALPGVLNEWKAKAEHARKLAKMAGDARWYCLASSALKTWRARTTEHQHQRRRDAYVQIRGRVKYKMAGKCFAIWRSKRLEVAAMKEEAQRRAQSRVFAVGMNAFDQWREASRAKGENELQAVSIDKQRLLVSAFAAMLARHSERVTLEQRALSFRMESDLALQASAFKSLQWATFTASQQIKTADALLVRNSEKHVKNMLRHWFMKASSLRAAKLDQPAEPESPSIRPASRVAARSASRERFDPRQSVSYTPGTPGYMRTPSRSRRAGRFRPIPTPAAVTPFAFEPGYLATTPAPFTAADDSSTLLPPGLTPQVTPFARKLRAGGFNEMPPSALKSSVFGRSTAAMGTGKSVRFASAGRFSRSTAGRLQASRRVEEEDEDGDGMGSHFKSS